MQGKTRYLSTKIIKLLEMFPAVAVLGTRQCGKSTLVKQLFPKWGYYDLERPDDYELINNDPLGFFTRHKNNVIIDEAQQYPQLFNILRSVIDNDRQVNGRFVLTGSSSPAIVKGLSESLAGRIATVELSPFKMAELEQLEFPEIYAKLVQEKTTVEDLQNLQTKTKQTTVYSHWMYGGYPEPRIKTLQNPMFHQLWMDAYFSDFIHRDIQRLFPRINPQNFRKMIRTLSFHSGNILNQSNIATALELSSVTIKEYLSILHDTFIWRNLTSFEKNPLKTVQKMPKGYYRDSGILHHLLKLNAVDDLLIHPIAGSSFESFMIEEIIRGLGCILESNMDFSFYRTRDKAEIDLIIDGSFGIIPIEIKLGSTVNQSMLKSLKIFIEDTQTKFGILINNAARIEIVADKIIQIPAHYF
ncbi:MAG: ATP-binding protein [Proteobacteria bacterium]|nr:ATP-binding protein [Pseudomonadota bacterium]